MLLWRVDYKSASSPDGLPLLVIDVDTGAQTELGYTLLYFVAWRAPHTLAYVAGAGRETWKDKTLSIWSTETGGASHAGLVGAPCRFDLTPRCC